MPSASMASAKDRIPDPEMFSERKSSSMMTIGKRNFIGDKRTSHGPTRPWLWGIAIFGMLTGGESA